MRITRLLTLLLAAVTVFSVYGREITRREACGIAEDFLKGRCVQLDLSNSNAEQLKAIGGNKTPEFYIFNRTDNCGFVIVSGDDAAPSILGFSTTGHIYADSISENLASHLDCLRQQIETARKLGLKSSPKRRGPTSQTGMRLVTPNWDQYSQMTPGNTPAGCVPTAMGLIMGAWHWPVRGEGVSTHSGSINQLGVDYDITLDHNVEFKLDNLPFDPMEIDDLNPDHELGLANLMYHTGVAVSANYAPGGTGATVSSARKALIEHFKFADDMDQIYYNQSFASIERRLRAELEAGRPAIYSAQSPGGGHAFVCDGVWDDYFHFNLGWGGYGNGYYLLNAINVSNDNFNYDPYILTNIKPRTTDPEYTTRRVEVVYDRLPDSGEEEQIVVSPDYSPIEFSNMAGGFGLVSPRASYKKGEYAYVYYSGLLLTGRFDGTSGEVASMPDSYVRATLALGIVDQHGEILEMFERRSSSYIYRDYAGSTVYSFGITPTIDIKPEYSLRMYAKVDGTDQWKEVKGLSNVSTCVSCAAPTSPYLPYKVSYDSNALKIDHVYGQLADKVVEGQSYGLFIYPKKPMESILITNHGKPIPFAEEIDSWDESTYYYMSITIDSPDGLDLVIEPLSKGHTDVAVHVDTPASLESLLEGIDSKIRSLTITGTINIFDLKYLNTPAFSQLVKLDMSGAKIVSYSPIHAADYIQGSFFNNHSSLEELALPNGLTQLGASAFCWCSNLKKLTIPATLATLGDYALEYGYYSEVYDKRPEPQDISEGFVANVQTPSTLYVPVGSKSAYESHPQWSKFTYIVEKDFGGIESAAADPTYSIRRSGNAIVIDGASATMPVRLYSISGALLWEGTASTLSGAPSFTVSPIIVATPKLTIKLK